MKVLSFSLPSAATFSVSAILLGSALVACSDGAGRETPQGEGTVTTQGAGPATPERVAIQRADLPGRFQKCPFAGEVNAYIENFKLAGSPAHNSLLSTWQELQSAGATDGYLAVYGNMRVACDNVLGKSQKHDPSFHDDPGGHPSTVWSFVFRFRDDDTAEAAYKSDIFGQSKLGGQGFDVVEGAPSGLGPNSLVGTNQADAPVRQAVWQNGSFTVFFGSENLPFEESETAISNINGRID